MTTTQNPGELVREIRQYLGANVHLASADAAALDDAALALARTVLGIQRRGEPVGEVAGQYMGAYSVGNIFYPKAGPLPVGTKLYAAPQPDAPAIRESRNTADPVLDAPAKIGHLLDAAHAAVELLDAIPDDPAAKRVATELSIAAASIQKQEAEHA